MMKLILKSIQIIQVGDLYIDDIKKILNELLKYYPDIFEWLKRKLNSRSINSHSFRISLLKYNLLTIGIIITQNKKKYVKVSTLYIKRPYRNRGYGTFFLKRELEHWEMRNKHRFIITVSEKVLESWPQFRYFLRKFKFNEGTIILDYYLKGENEIIFIRENLSISRPIIISIKPEFAKLIKNKEKIVEIRKQILKEMGKGIKVYIYESSPTRKIIGYFFIEKISCGTPKKLWEKSKIKIAISKQEFNKYCETHDKIYGIYIEALHLYNKGIEIDYLKKKISKWYPPQNMSYCSNQLHSLLEEIN